MTACGGALADDLLAGCLRRQIWRAAIALAWLLRRRTWRAGIAKNPLKTILKAGLGYERQSCFCCFIFSAIIFHFKYTDVNDKSSGS